MYQSRMHFARDYRLDLSGAVHRFDMKRKHLKSFNDYYLIKCRCIEDYAVFKKQKKGTLWLLLFIMVLCSFVPHHFLGGSLAPISIQVVMENALGE
jgi:hypothetical protein